MPRYLTILLLALAPSLLLALAPSRGDAQMMWCDPIGDASPRLTDTGADGPFDPVTHRLPDLRSIQIGAWSPLDPEADLYDGIWDPSGMFFRLDLEFVGLMNPPGPLDCCGDPFFDPFRYGPHPLYGYVEIDMDDDVDTGGELEQPRHRYTGNVARYGGYPPGAAFVNRIARDGRAFDGNVETPPLVERSGEDFHITFAGWEIDGSGIERSDESDWIFGPGETWLVPGHLFQRAHAYRRYSSACCRAGAPVGSYEPLVTLRFSHNVSTDRTLVSLVYPLTNAGSAAVNGDAQAQPPDPFYTNHNSIEEALMELVISAMSATPIDRSEPEFALIEKWEFKDPQDYLDPTAWRLTVLVGGSYTAPQSDGLFVWSDVWPNPVRADFEGDMTVDVDDIQLFNNYLLDSDGAVGFDVDGVVNGRIVLQEYGRNFSMFDVNNDGIVDNADRLQIIPVPPIGNPDFDGDGDADQTDFSLLQRCLTGPDAGFAAVGCNCMVADLDRDHDVDQDDFSFFESCARGSHVPVDQDCRLMPPEQEE